MHSLSGFLTLMLLSAPLSAGEVSIVAVEIEPQAGRYLFHVTLRHEDSGWQHYANAWRVRSPDGRILGERVLYHPHVNEQPFTRSLSGVEIPKGTPWVEIEAEDSRHGTNSHRWRVPITE